LCAWELLPEPILYVSAYFEAHRRAYYERLLAVSQEGAWEAWLRFFLRGVVDQSRDALVRARRLQDLRERYRDQLQVEQTGARLLQVVDLLFDQPLVTVTQVSEALDVTFASANHYVQQLEEAGILREITGQARNRVYRADEVLAAIEGDRGT
jgi:Fic family protein